jgi:hypothetical protein
LASLTATKKKKFYALNSGLHLHKHADIHIRDGDGDVTSAEEEVRLGFIRRNFGHLSLRRHSTGSLRKASRHPADEELVSIL